jgi:hypothetical protein
MNARWACGLVATLVLAGTPAWAQALQVQGGNQVLQITTALPGTEPTQVVNTSTSLRYRRQSQMSKITVSSACPGQRFTLRLRAVSVQDGNPAPSVLLVHGMPATDLIRNIPALVFLPFPRRATLEYTASSTFDQGNSTELGVDAHVVTFTLVAQ